MISATNDVVDIEQIAAALAHEVKNPLTLVRARIDLLESNDEKADNKKNYNLIRKELNKINEIILEFINITQATSEEDFDYIYISDIILSITEKYRDIYRNRINFIINTECTDIAILGLEKTIQILFNNIIKNALEAIEEDGQIVISIETNNVHDSITVTVKDTGKGLPENLEDKIYENFFTTKEFGSGLGLSICQKIVQDHKGNFSISNNNSVGCTAKVSFPIRR